MFFFKQKRAYEMRISDWSSDVCSSDLWCATRPGRRRLWIVTPSTVASRAPGTGVISGTLRSKGLPRDCTMPRAVAIAVPGGASRSGERRVGTECVIRVVLGGRRIIKKKTTNERRRGEGPKGKRK